MSISILIVENELDIADIIRRYLEFEGFTATCVISCEEARVACAAHLPDIIVLDWHLPGISGDEWVDELRAHPATADIPIIMMTGGYPTPGLLAHMAAAEIPLLIKPFSLDQLVEYIERVSARQRIIGAD
jgi:two-component system phosphate regulon response regulator PhoB